MRRYSFLAILLFCISLCSCRDNEQALLGYIQGRYLYLAPSGAGVLWHRYVSRGGFVKQGQLLFQLDPNPEQAQLDQAKAQLSNAEQTLANLMTGSRHTVLAGIIAQIRQANADLNYAAKTLKRQQQLYQQKAVSKSILDKAASSYHVAKQQVAQLQAKLLEARLGARDHLIKAQRALVAANIAAVQRWQWQLSQKSVHAPVSGQVFDTFYKQGEFVSSGSPVLALLSPKNINLIFFVPEAQLALLKIGAQVSFRCDNCGSSIHAKINYIAPTAEYTPVVLYSQEARQKLVYRVEATVPANKVTQIHPGQPVDVYLGHNSE